VNVAINSKHTYFRKGLFLDQVVMETEILLLDVQWFIAEYRIAIKSACPVKPRGLVFSFLAAR
jgi:hypothetical protein